jgi:hypothetical protein
LGLDSIHPLETPKVDLDDDVYLPSIDRPEFSGARPTRFVLDDVAVKNAIYDNIAMNLKRLKKTYRKKFPFKADRVERFLKAPKCLPNDEPLPVELWFDFGSY